MVSFLRLVVAVKHWNLSREWKFQLIRVREFLAEVNIIVMFMPGLLRSRARLAGHFRRSLA